MCLQVGQLCTLGLTQAPNTDYRYMSAGLLVLRGTPPNPCHTFRCLSSPSPSIRCLFTFEYTSARKLSGSGKDFSGHSGLSERITRTGMASLARPGTDPHPLLLYLVDHAGVATPAPMGTLALLVPPPSSPRSRCVSIQEKRRSAEKKSAPRSLHDRHRVPAARDRADRSKNTDESMACRNGERVSGRGGGTSGGLTCAMAVFAPCRRPRAPWDRAAREAAASCDAVDRDQKGTTSGFVTQRGQAPPRPRGGTPSGHCRDETRA